MMVAGAVAAASLVWLKPAPAPVRPPAFVGGPVAVKHPGTRVPAAPAPAPVAMAPALAPVVAPVVASEIVQADFGVNTGTIFEVALAEGESTQVVWINEDEP